MQVEERGGGDAGTSTTTSDEEMNHNPLPPKGLRRHRFIYCVGAHPAVPVTRLHLLTGQTPTGYNRLFQFLIEGERCTYE